ncbi:MAG TPA: alkaline phosphatase PhoX [Rhizomicrobium sp.]|nr:alkaline phosphatase PhoX [Rhizomicrobium sp.]
MKSLKKKLVATALLVSIPAAALAADGIGPFTNGVLTANPAVGAPANVVSSDFTATQVVTGTDPLENPSGVITTFGKLSNGTNTEPDQNIYVIIPDGVKGPTPKYNYGTHFLFQGHELFAGNQAYVTRVNLDVTDPAHRITLLTPVGGDGLTHLSSLDGITYNASTKTLLVTQEASSTTGGVIEVDPKVVGKVTTHYGSMGRCGVEGVHVDNKGHVYLVEDAGGTSASNDKNNINGSVKVAKQPNSYVYRFLPYQAKNLSAGGKLQALQVSVDGSPLTFGGTTADQVFADVWSGKQRLLHSGKNFPTKWVTIHDTATDGTTDFDCNAAARTAGATPFKRPENGVFAPNGKYDTFFFAITGDTNNLSGSVPELAARGAWGGIFEVNFKNDNEGRIKMIVRGDADHNSFDNVTMGDSNTLLASEDRGDTLHDQLNALDSIWAYPLNNLSSPLRLLAQGRDVSASAAGLEDNEPTGIHVSNGGITKADTVGTAGNLPNARGFFTQQHGDNTIYELVHK